MNVRIAKKLQQAFSCRHLHSQLSFVIRKYYNSMLHRRSREILGGVMRYLI